MNMSVTKKQEEVLRILADERRLNPQTSLHGLHMKTLGNKAGAYLGWGIMYDAYALKSKGYVSISNNRVAITQKGLQYISSPAITIKMSLFKHPSYWWSLFGVIALFGLIAWATGNLPVLFFGVGGSLIATLLLQVNQTR